MKSSIPAQRPDSALPGTDLALSSPLLRQRVRVRLIETDRLLPRLAEFMSLLSAEERERAARFAVDHARRNFVVTRAALRMWLSQELGVSAQAITFRYDAKGKPFLDGGGGSVATFNVSHSGDRSLIALANSVRVGVDIERVDDGRDLCAIARACWSPPEQKILDRADPREAARLFYRIWTRKEAVLKASGQGITGGLQTPDVSAGLPEESSPHGFAVPLAQATWHVADLFPASGYAGALAVEVIPGTAGAPPPAQAV